MPKTEAVNPEFIKMAKGVAALRAKAEKAEEALSAAKEAHRAAAMGLAKHMIQSKLKNFSVTGLGTVYVATEFYPLIKDREAWNAWLKKDKEGKKLFKMTVNGNTQKSFIVERFNNKGALPSSEILDVTNHIESVVRIKGEKEVPKA